MYPAAPRVDSDCNTYPAAPRVDSDCNMYPAAPRVDSDCNMYPPAPRVDSDCNMYPPAPAPRVDSDCNMYPAAPRVDSDCNMYPAAPRVDSDCNILSPAPRVDCSLSPAPRVDGDCSAFSPLLLDNCSSQLSHTKKLSPLESFSKTLPNNALLSSKEGVNLLSRNDKFYQDTALNDAPYGKKENVYFFIYNTSNRNKRSNNQLRNFTDDCGAWMAGKG
ncbi:uncharacterized protein LOC144744844 isoform X2 [Ciona intestinalis]